MIHTAYSSIHTHVSSLIPRMMCRTIRVLLRDSPDDVQDNHGPTQGYV